MIHTGDCLEVMAGMADASVDAVVTDPPYGLEFMGKAWDSADKLWGKMDGEWKDRPKGGTHPFANERPRYVAGHSFQAWCEAWGREALRVTVPGGYLLAFGGTRTHHRLLCGLEDAGWEIRDCLVWAYASGFPKSLDVSKAIDKAQGNKTADLGAFIRTHREQRGLSRQQAAAELFGKESGAFWNWEEGLPQGKHPGPDPALWARIKSVIGAPDSQWDSLMEQAQREITGERDSGLDKGSGTTVSFAKGRNANGLIDITAPATPDAARWDGWGTALKPAWEPIVMARKPLRGTVAANVLAHGTGALNIDGTRIGTTKDVPASPSQMEDVRTHGKFGPTPTDTEGWNPNSGRWPSNVLLTDPIFDGGVTHNGSPLWAGVVGGGEAGTYSRFFLIPKAARSDREPLLRPDGHAADKRFSTHPTMKPTELMRHLVRLVTPPGGTVLDPFLGSGTTAIACEMEGFAWIGIEKEPEYVAIAEARLNGVQKGMGLTG